MTIDKSNPNLSPYTKVIAICGGVGSGKSQVSERLEALGYSVIYTDKINKELLAEKDYLMRLAQVFPECFSEGKLDKAKLKALVFADEGKRKALNSIAHPQIAARIAQKAASLKGVVFVEVPLFIESGASNFGFDAVWAVVTDRDKRIERITKREGISPEFAAKMIDAQHLEDEIAKIADVIIDNNGDLDGLIQLVDKAARTLHDVSQ